MVTQSDIKDIRKHIAVLNDETGKIKSTLDCIKKDIVDIKTNYAVVKNDIKWNNKLTMVIGVAILVNIIVNIIR